MLIVFKVLFMLILKYVWRYYLARSYACWFPIPVLVDLLVAWYFWMKLAKLNQMANEMKKRWGNGLKAFIILVRLYKYEQEHLPVEELSNSQMES